MSRLPDVREFLTFARTLEGKRLLTVGGRAFFRVASVADGLVYYPESSGKHRKQKRERIEKILARHRETGSLSVRDYQKLTRHSSYALGILRLYLVEHAAR